MSSAKQELSATDAARGGLDWALVHPLIAAAPEPFTDVRALVY